MGDPRHENALTLFQKAFKSTPFWSGSGIWQWRWRACLRLNVVQALVVVGIGTGRLALSPRGLARSGLRGRLGSTS